MYRAVDVMSFAGGFTLGMVQAGFSLVGKRELPGGFGVPSCEANRHLLGESWKTQVSDPAHWETVPDTDVVFGNPPCSGFSVMSAKNFRGANSKINECMWSFARYVSRARPTIAVFESVQQAFTNLAGQQLMRDLRAYVEEQSGLKYTLYHIRHNAYSVGGAAQRRRYFWLISQVPFGVSEHKLTSFPVLNNVLGDLVDLPLTWSDQPYTSSTSHPWAHDALSPARTTDGHQTMDTPLTRRLEQLLQSVDWLPGEHLTLPLKRHYAQHGKLPPLFAPFEAKIVRQDFNVGFTTPTRWDGNKHARVITGAALQCVVHPTLPRTITHREAARILGFPDDWLIEPVQKVVGMHMTWGKGISVQCGKWIGRQISEALNGNPGKITGTLLGEREYDINLTHSWQWQLGMRNKPVTSYGIVKQVARPTDFRSLSEGRTMTDEAPVEGEATPETAENAEAATRAGRPRPQATIDRDNTVFEQLNEGAKTSKQLSSELELAPSTVYLSLHRLRKDGRVAKGAGSGRNQCWHQVGGITEPVINEFAVPTEPVVEGAEPAVEEPTPAFA